MGLSIMKCFIFLSLMFIHSNITGSAISRMGEFCSDMALGNLKVPGEETAKQIKNSTVEIIAATTTPIIKTTENTLTTVISQTPLKDALGKLKQAGSHFFAACKDTTTENTKALALYIYRNWIRPGGKYLCDAAKSGATSAWNGTKYGCGVAYDYTSNKVQSGATIAKNYACEKAQEYPKTTAALVATPVCYVLAKAKLETAKAQLQLANHLTNVGNALAVNDRLRCVYARNLQLQGVPVKGFWQRAYVLFNGIPAVPVTN